MCCWNLSNGIRIKTKSMEKEVLFEKEKNIAIITFNRPQRYNAVNQDLVDGINDSLSIVENDNDIRHEYAEIKHHGEKIRELEHTLL